MSSRLWKPLVHGSFSVWNVFKSFKSCQIFKTELTPCYFIFTREVLYSWTSTGNEFSQFTLTHNLRFFPARSWSLGSTVDGVIFAIERMYVSSYDVLMPHVLMPKAAATDPQSAGVGNCRDSPRIRCTLRGVDSCGPLRDQLWILMMHQCVRWTNEGWPQGPRHCVVDTRIHPLPSETLGGLQAPQAA